MCADPSLSSRCPGQGGSGLYSRTGASTPEPRSGEKIGFFGWPMPQLPQDEAPALFAPHQFKAEDGPELIHTMPQHPWPADTPYAAWS